MRRFLTSVGIAAVMPFLFKKPSLNQITQFERRQMIQQQQQEIKTSINKIFLSSEQSQFSLLRVFAFDAQILGKQVTAHLDISLGRHYNQRFNDGQIKIRLLDSVRDQDVYLLKSFQNKNINDGVMQLLLAVSCMKKQGARSVTTIIPYFPYTGSVTVTPSQLNQGDDFYTCFAADIIKMLQASGCDAIITLNTLMSNPKGFTTLPFINIQAPQIIIPYLLQRHLQNPIIIGSRANPTHVRNVNSISKTFQKLNHPTGIGFFNSDDYIGESVKNRNILLYSNLIRSGQTMRKQVAKLKKQGANQIYSFGFHGLCTNQLFDSLVQSLPIQELMMTNSIFHAQQNKKVRSLSVAKLLAQVISLLSTEKSLSQYRGQKQAFQYYYLNKMSKFNSQKNKNNEQV